VRHAQPDLPASQEFENRKDRKTLTTVRIVLDLPGLPVDPVIQAIQIGGMIL
jgi:hypothetical protein